MNANLLIKIYNNINIECIIWVKIKISFTIKFMETILRLDLNKLLYLFILKEFNE